MSSEADMRWCLPGAVVWEWRRMPFGLGRGITQYVPGSQPEYGSGEIGAVQVL